MPFPDAVVEDLLLRCGRHCCLCHKFKGAAIEIHHIDRSLVEGRDDADNGIPLCFDCHTMVGSYSVDHPRGRRYRPSELRVLRDRWFAAFDEHGLQAGIIAREGTPGVPAIQQNVTGDGNLVAGGDVLVNSRKLVRVRFTPGAEHIPESTAAQIKNLVDELVNLEKLTRNPPANAYQKWWTKLQRQFAVATYRAIPRDQGDAAITWLQQQKALLRPRLRRAAPDAWRKEHYAAIYARAREMKIEKDALYELARVRLNLRKPISSLSDLGERDLVRLYRLLFQ